MLTHDHAPAQPAAELLRDDLGPLQPLAAEWTALCSQSAADSPFVRPEWIAAYLRAFEPRSRVLLATGHEGGRLCAVLPLIQEKARFCGLPVRMLRGAGNVHSCRFDLVRSAGPAGVAGVQMLWHQLRDLPDWDLIELPYVPENGSAEELLQVAGEDGYLTGKYEAYTSPFVRVGDRSVDTIPTSSHFRRNLNRRKRKAAEKWDVSLRRIDTAEPGELNRFFQLEAGGWKGKEETAITCSDATRRFYEDIARLAAKSGYFSLYLLEFDQTVVAGHFGLYDRDRYYSPKVAYNEAFAEYGPGHLIVDAILRDLRSRNVVEFDFLGPWMDWKAEWTREGRVHSFCYIFRPGLYGRTLYAAKLTVLDKLRRSDSIRRVAGALHLTQSHPKNGRES